MKNIWKHTVFFSLFLGAAAFLGGCAEDEELNLGGYGETRVGISIVGYDEPGTTVRLKANYDAEGKLSLNGSLTRTYVVQLSSSSHEEVVIDVEPIIVNIPENKVSISTRQLKYPVGVKSAEVTVEYLDEDDFSFAESMLDQVTYELGIKIVDAKGYLIEIEDTEAKVMIRKDAYASNLSLAGESGFAKTFRRAFWNGQINNTDEISYTFTAALDRPAHADVKISLHTSGLAPKFEGDVSITPSHVVIPAGELLSEEFTWSITDGFLLTNDKSEEYTLTVTATVESGDSYVKFAEDEFVFTFDVIKEIMAFEAVSTLPGSWVMYDRSTWSAQSSMGDAGAIIDGSTSTSITAYNDLWVSVDMQENKQIAGIVTRTWYNLASYAPSSVNISISDDGVSWESIGTQVFPSKSATYHFNMLEIMTARHIRLEMTGNTMYFAQMEVYGPGN